VNEKIRQVVKMKIQNRKHAGILFNASIGNSIARYCIENDITVIVDISNVGAELVNSLRQTGYLGLILTINPDASLRQNLLQACVTDSNWIVLPCGLNTSSSQENFNDTKTILANLEKLFCKQLYDRVGAIHMALAKADEELFQKLRSVFPNLGFISASSTTKDEEEQQHLSEVSGFAFSSYSGDLGLMRNSANYARIDDIVQLKRADIDISAIITSMGGFYKRPDKRGRDWGRNWFNSCLTSWKNFAPECFSIAEVAPPVSDISWVMTKQKPRIVEILQKIPAHCKGHIVLTNSDVLFTDSLKMHLPSLDPDVFYFGKRMDVIIDPEDPTGLLSLDYYFWGYDIFIIPHWAIQKLKAEKTLPAFLKYGEPFWDWGLPLAMMLSGVPAKRLELAQPAILHLNHGRDSNAWWKVQGLQFLQWCHELDQLPYSAGKSVAGKLAARRKLAKQNPDTHLVAACKDFMDWFS
jgi:hypothetical protein